MKSSLHFGDRFTKSSFFFIVTAFLALSSPLIATLKMGKSREYGLFVTTIIFSIILMTLSNYALKTKSAGSVSLSLSAAIGAGVAFSIIPITVFNLLLVVLAVLSASFVATEPVLGDSKTRGIASKVFYCCMAAAIVTATLRTP